MSIRAGGRRGIAAVTSVVAGLALSVGLVPAAEAGVQIPSVPQVNPADDTPRVVDDAVISNSGVREFVQIGGTMYAGGEFNTVRDASGTTSYTRTNLFSFDPSTGAVSSWAPKPTGNDGSVAGGDVYALEASPDGRYLYVGGDFRRWDGVFVNKVVKIDLTTMTRVPGFKFFLNTSSRVSDLEVVGDRLFAAGTFAGGIVAVNANTGAKDPYFDATQAAGSESGYSNRIYRFSISPDGSRMVVLGSFTSIGGQPRQQAAMLTLGESSAGVSGWSSDRFNLDCSSRWRWYTRDVDWSLDGRSFGIVTTGGPYSNTLCDAVTWWASTDVKSDPVWVNYTGGDTVHSINVTDRGVFVGGHFRWLDNPEGRDFAGPGAVAAQGLGLIDQATGKAIRWNPRKSLEGGDGAYDLYFSPRGLWVGHFENKIRGENHEGLGVLPF